MALRHPHLRTVEGQATTAQVNAGLIIVPEHPGRTITVVDAWMRAIGGAATTNTSVDIMDTADSPDSAVAFARAGLTQNAVLRAGASNTTATDLGKALGTGEGLQIKTVGTAMTVATHIDYQVMYVIDTPQA